MDSKDGERSRLCFETSHWRTDSVIVRMTGSGRVCEITSGRFVEAKQETRLLGVQLLRRSVTGRSGSIPVGPDLRHTAEKRSYSDPSNGLLYLFQNASTAFMRRRFSVVT